VNTSMLAAPRPYRDGAFGNGVALHHAGRGRQSSATQLREIAADQAVSLAIHPGKVDKQRKYISVVLAASHPCPTSDGLETT
jgi:hypothetical protein